MTSERLRLLRDNVDQAMSDSKYSALIITSRCSQIAVPEQDPEAPITNFDHKTISAGLALKETLLECDDDIEAVQSSLESLQNDYYSLVKLLERKDDSSKPVFNIIDGEIPFSASHFYLSPKQNRVITEHAFTYFGINSYSNAPIPPLGLLKCISNQDKSARVPPKGSALYISLAPPNLLLLRGPELLRLGMADYFIPDAKYVDTLKEMKNNAPCPAPHTEEAVKVVLEMHKAYAGPDKIGVWQKEIEEVFGDFPSVSQILERLRDIKKPWSDGIIQHLEKQSPTLLEVIVRAVNQVMNQDMSLEACIDLEQQLNIQWRRTSDFKLVVADQIEENSGHISSWADLDSVVVNRMFSEPTTLLPTAEYKIKEYRLVMPSTESNEEVENVEAATTTTSEDDEEIFVCPVTGMRGKMPAGHEPVAIQPTA
jgi:Enoyl-CoA hydratase/isomerase